MLPTEGQAPDLGPEPRWQLPAILGEDGSPLTLTLTLPLRLGHSGHVQEQPGGQRGGNVVIVVTVVGGGQGSRARSGRASGPLGALGLSSGCDRKVAPQTAGLQ